MNFAANNELALPPGRAQASPTTWLVLTIAFAALAIWRVRMIRRVVKRLAP